MWCKLCRKYLSTCLAFKCVLCKSFFCKKCSHLTPYELAAIELPKKMLLIRCEVCKNNAYATPDCSFIRGQKPGYLEHQDKVNKQCCNTLQTTARNLPSIDQQIQKLNLVSENKDTNSILYRSLQQNEVIATFRCPAGKRRKLEDNQVTADKDIESVKFLTAGNDEIASSWGCVKEIPSNSAGQVKKVKDLETVIVLEENHGNSVAQVKKLASNMTKIELDVVKCLAEAKKKMATHVRTHNFKSANQFEKFTPLVAGIVHEVRGSYVEESNNIVRDGCNMSTDQEMHEINLASDNKGADAIVNRYSQLNKVMDTARCLAERKHKLEGNQITSKADNKSINLLTADKDKVASLWGYLKENPPNIAGQAEQLTCRTELQENHAICAAQAEIVASKMTKVELEVAKCLAEGRKKMKAHARTQNHGCTGRFKILRQQMSGIVHESVGGNLETSNTKVRDGCVIARNECNLIRDGCVDSDLVEVDVQEATVVGEASENQIEASSKVTTTDDNMKNDGLKDKDVARRD